MDRSPPVLLLAALLVNIAFAWSTFKRPLSSIQLHSSPWGKANEETNDLSVGDYVKGVHGGKYQFGAAGLNTAGLEFAETGYASQQPIQEDDMMRPDHSFPKWAMRLGMDQQELQRRAIQPMPSTMAVTVQNQERTWEPFYVKIIRVNDANQVVDDTLTNERYTVQPIRGKLAPLGGAQNPYKPNEPYSDSVTIQVEAIATRGRQNDYFLVIGTEEEQWFYRLT